MPAPHLRRHMQLPPLHTSPNPGVDPGPSAAPEQQAQRDSRMQRCCNRACMPMRSVKNLRTLVWCELSSARQELVWQL
eukprot:1150811-Pelagomonas_calceolata.AAC.2